MFKYKKNQKNLFSNNKLIIFAVLILHRGGIQGSRSFFKLRMSGLENILKKSLKIFCQFKKTLYFCTRKRKQNGFEFVNREEIIKDIKI